MTDLQQKLWELANLITGFCIVQGIALLYAAGKTDMFEKIASVPELLFNGILIGIFIFHVIYIFSVRWCHAKLRSLATSQNNSELHSVSKIVMRAQIIVIFVIGFICVLAFYNFVRSEQGV